MKPDPMLEEPFPPIPRWVLLACGFFGLYLFGLLAGYSLTGMSGMAAWHSLMFGWLQFPLRRLGVAHPDWPSLLMGFSALVLLFITLHKLGRRVTQGLHETGRWTWRSTLTVTGGVIVLFAGGVAIVGAGHQSIWLATDARSSKAGASSSVWPEPPGPLDILQQARLAAIQTQSRNNLKQIMMAIHNYQDNYYAFPPGSITDESGHSLHGLVFQLSHYAGFYTKTDWKTEPWDGPQNQQYARGALPEFVNPQLGWHGQFDEHGYAYMHYAANVHGFPNNRGLKMAEITDGTSNTLAIGEVAENFQPWASPWNRRDPTDGINDVPWGFGGPPAQSGAMFAFFDGQVRLIGRNIDRSLLRSLGLPNDGNPAEDWENKLR